MLSSNGLELLKLVLKYHAQLLALLFCVRSRETELVVFLRRLKPKL